MEEKKFLTTKELCERWSITRSTLSLWRKNNRGPKFISFKDGCSRPKILYRLDDVVDFESKNENG